MMQKYRSYRVPAQFSCGLRPSIDAAFLGAAGSLLLCSVRKS